MQFKKSQQFALGFLEFDGVGGAAQEFGFEAFGGGAHRVALFFFFFSNDPCRVD